MLLNKFNPGLALNGLRTTGLWFVSSLGYIVTIYMGKQKISVGKSNGQRLSVWEASENMGCDLRPRNFSTLFSLFT